MNTTHKRLPFYGNLHAFHSKFIVINKCSSQTIRKIIDQKLIVSKKNIGWERIVLVITFQGWYRKSPLCLLLDVKYQENNF